MEERICDVCYGDYYECNKRCEVIKSLARDLYTSDHLTVEVLKDLLKIPFENEYGAEAVDLWGDEKYSFADDLQEALDRIKREKCNYCAVMYKLKDENGSETCEVCHEKIYYCGQCNIGTRDYKALCKYHLESRKGY
jgi:hypothetical protein